MMRLTLLSLFLSLTFSLFANGGGYEIIVKLNNFTETEAYLATYYGEQPYIKDTISVNDEGLIIFKGDEPLEAGVYLIVLPPNNQFLQVFIDEKNQNFTLEADYKELNKSDIQIKGSKDNQLFYDYVRFLNEKSPAAGKLREEIKAAEAAGKDVTKLREKLDVMNNAVKSFQLKLMEENPNSPIATWIGFGLEPDIPEFEGDEKEVQFKQYQYRKMHFFDRVNMNDPGLYHNPMLYKKIDYFLEKLTPPAADSINYSLDFILSKLEKNEKTFEYYLRHFLNKYAESKVVGMDAVYVHLVDEYYSKGKAPWIEQEQLDKIKLEATRMRPILIGKKAMDIKMTKEDGSKISLYDIDAEYTVLFFWRPGCSHCKKATPKVLDFYEKYKSKGVKVMASCIKTGEKASECWEFVKEKKMEPLLNVFDPFNSAQFYQKYDTRITPRILILDKDKKILINRIGAEQLEEVMDQIIEQEQMELDEKNKGK